MSASATVLVKFGGCLQELACLLRKELQARMSGDLPDPCDERHAEVSSWAMHTSGHAPGVSVCAYFVEDNGWKHEEDQYRTLERAYDWSIFMQGGGEAHNYASRAALVEEAVWLIENVLAPLGIPSLASSGSAYAAWTPQRGFERRLIDEDEPGAFAVYG